MGDLPPPPRGMNTTLVQHDIQCQISSIRDLGVLANPEALLLVLPAIFAGVVMYLCLRRYPSPATLPLLMAAFLGTFFAFLWVTGTTLEVFDAFVVVIVVVVFLAVVLDAVVVMALTFVVHIYEKSSSVPLPQSLSCYVRIGGDQRGKNI